MQSLRVKNFRKLNAVILAGILATSAFVPVYADTYSSEDFDRVDEELNATQSDLEDVQSRISELESKKGEAEAYLTELNNQLSELTDQLTALQSEYAENQRQLDSTNQELANAKQDEEIQRENMGIRIQYMYEHDAGSNGLEAILSAHSFTDMLNAASDISELESYDRKALKEYEDTCTKIENTEAELQKEKSRLEGLTEESTAKKAEISELFEETKNDVAVYTNSLEGEKQSQDALLTSIAEQQKKIEDMRITAAEEVAKADAAAKAQEAAEKQKAAQQSQQAAKAAAPAAQTSAKAESSNTGSGSAGSSSSSGNAASSSYGGTVLTRAAGRIQGPSGGETYYNLDMSGIVNIMRNMGNTDEYWVRDDGVKMLGDYVMVAANLSVHPRGSIVATSLGQGIVVDTGGFASQYPNNLDIATNW